MKNYGQFRPKVPSDTEEIAVPDEFASENVVASEEPITENLTDQRLTIRDGIVGSIALTSKRKQGAEVLQDIGNSAVETEDIVERGAPTEKMQVSKMTTPEGSSAMLGEGTVDSNRAVLAEAPEKKSRPKKATSPVAGESVSELPVKKSRARKTTAGRATTNGDSGNKAPVARSRPKKATLPKDIVETPVKKSRPKKTALLDDEVEAPVARSRPKKAILPKDIVEAPIKKSRQKKTALLDDEVVNEEVAMYLGVPTGPLQNIEPVGDNEQNASKLKSQKRKRTVLLSVVAASLVFVIVAGVVWKLVIQATPSVTLYNVGAGNTDQGVGGGGTVFPLQQLDVSYPVPERVVNILVKAGDQVTPNQALVQLDPSQLNTQVNQAANDLSAAQSYLNTVNASGNLQQIAQAQEDYNVKKNRYDALVAQNSSSLMRQGSLISPMNGIVTSVNVNPGQVIAANAPLLTIMDESKVIVHVQIPLSNFGLVHIGQQATINPATIPNLNLKGTVSSVVPQADPQTDSFQVWVQVSNADSARARLLPGMTAFVRIQTQAPQKGHAFSVSVPRLAVLDPGSAGTVFVVRNGHAFIQRVEVAARVDDTVLVDQGLQKGDKVVLDGVDQLQDGQKVRVDCVVSTNM